MTKLPHLRWRDRCAFKRKHFYETLFWLVLSAIAVYGLWYGITASRANGEYIRAVERHAEAQVAKAERDRQEVLDVLAGKLSMVEPLGENAGYARVAEVKWHVVKLEGN